MANSNEDLLRRGYAAFASGDLETVQSLFAEDIVWHSGGANRLTGEYIGHDQVLNYLMELLDFTDGTFRIEVHDILANDMHGMVLVTMHGERDGRTLAAREVNIWRIEDGKAREFWSFAEDGAEFDKFFG
jgi:ketosteroid isomerase-like protein